jgi:D-alanyl-D-alanine carboxypeptidase
MYRVSVGASNGLRGGILILVALLAFLAVATDSAEARWHRKRGQADSATSDARYADVVVDANTGETLHDVNSDGLRHPASLTKMMTLYLLFERLEAGKLKLNTPLEVSANAAEQAPSKLGLEAGDTIAVEDAIKALVTKSANDVAVVVAEALGGSEENFAKMMTRKARALAMKYTVYKNASGLPDDDQVTTARDQALLGIALQERFPRYYQYFSTPQFTYRGDTMRNHNHLLGRVAGVDGIKTGYTRASGFNLITSVHRENRHIVAVVMGGRTAEQRDARMRQLIETQIKQAASRRIAPKVAENAEPADTRAKPQAAAPVAAKADTATTAAIPRPRPQPGSTDPIQPRLVKTFSVKSSVVQTASLEPVSLPPAQTLDVTQRPNPSAAGTEDSGTLPLQSPRARPGIVGVPPAQATVASAQSTPAPAPVAAPQASPDPPVTAYAPAPALDSAASMATSVRAASAAPVAPVPATPVAPAPAVKAHSGWMIQVGAFEDEGDAKQRLVTVQGKVTDLLRKADPFTEPVTKGDKKFYRARFAGLDKEAAETACKHLKRSDIACIAIRN